MQKLSQADVEAEIEARSLRMEEVLRKASGQGLGLRAEGSQDSGFRVEA